jgi:uncharacterized protein
MSIFFFASDLHGNVSRFEKLFQTIIAESPRAVLLGGDLLPGRGSRADHDFGDFLRDFLVPQLRRLKETMADSFPIIGVIMGNDDARIFESGFREIEAGGFWHYLNNCVVAVDTFLVVGYSFIPPTPFALKDWEKYDVSRYVDPGCTPPDEGIRSVPADYNPRTGTIVRDLDELAGRIEPGRTIVLFHSPPYDTTLDRAGLDGEMIDHVPLDVHVGSIAIRRFIESYQPLLTLHGHVHESTRLTGRWLERLGDTSCFGAAHDGPELALIVFDPAAPGEARRILF